MTVAGRFAYAWADEDRPARLDAALTAPEIDLDRVNALGKAMLGGAAFDWPREGALSLKIGRAIIAGVEAKQTDVNMRLGANGLEIEQLAVADFGGAALAVKGRIDTKAQSPRGALTLDFDARALDGVLVLLEKFAPQAADQLRRSAGRLTPLVLRASLAVDPGARGARRDRQVQDRWPRRRLPPRAGRRCRRRQRCTQARHRGARGREGECQRAPGRR